MKGKNDTKFIQKCKFKLFVKDNTMKDFNLECNKVVRTSNRVNSPYRRPNTKVKCDFEKLSSGTKQILETDLQIFAYTYSPKATYFKPNKNIT